MWTGNIVQKGDIWTMELNAWKGFHNKKFIYVSLTNYVSINNARIGKTLSSTAINSLVSVGMARVEPTFIEKQNRIPISTSKVQVTAAPIPPRHSKTSDENLTEGPSVRTDRLNVLSQPISDSLLMNTILSSGCCCGQKPIP